MLRTNTHCVWILAAIVPACAAGGIHEPDPGSQAAQALMDNEPVYDEPPQPNPSLPPAPQTPPQIGTCPTAAPAVHWEKSWSKKFSFGGSFLGATGDGALTLSTDGGGGIDPDRGAAVATFVGDANLFGTKHRYLKGEIGASMVGTASSAYVTVSAKGRDVLNIKTDKHLNIDIPVAEMTFAKAGAPVIVGPFTISATAKVRGEVRMRIVDAGFSLASRSVSIQVEPSAAAFVVGEASISLLTAEAGIRGVFDIARLGLPATAQLAMTSPVAVWSVDLDAKWSALGGHLDAYAKLFGVGIWRKRLVSWDPLIDGQTSVAHLRSCTQRVVRPVCGNQKCEANESFVNCEADCPRPPSFGPGTVIWTSPDPVDRHAMLPGSSCSGS